MKYPLAGALQSETVTRLVVNPRRNSSPASTPPVGAPPAGDLRYFLVWSTEDDDDNEGVTRGWWAVDAAHAREQHEDAFPEERIRAIEEAQPPEQNPAPRGNASGSWEVVSEQGGVEGIFADEHDAQFFADELRRIGVADAKHRRRGPRKLATAGKQNPGAMSRDEAFEEFRNLIRDPDPAAMLIAEDLALEYRWTLVALSHYADRDSGAGGVFVLSPLNPADAPIYRIAWQVDPMFPQGHGDRQKPVFGLGFSFTWHDQEHVLTMASTTRYHRSREAAARAAAADAWAMAKKMKELMVTEPQLSITGVRLNLMNALMSPDATPPELYEHRSTRATGETPKKLPTYLEARDDLLAALRRAGWRMSDPGLRLPWASSPNNVLRLWFRPQAVHYTTVKASGDHHASRETHSLSYDLDIRKITPSEFIALVKARFPRGFQ